MSDVKAEVDKNWVRTVQITLDEYELGNLIGAMKRAANNGDWYHQVMHKLRQSVYLLGIDNVCNNFGDNLTQEDIAQIRGA